MFNRLRSWFEMYVKHSRSFENSLTVSFEGSSNGSNIHVILEANQFVRRLVLRKKS